MFRHRVWLIAGEISIRFLFHSDSKNGMHACICGDGWLQCISEELVGKIWVGR